MSTKPVLMSLAAVSKELDISLSIIYKWVKDGKVIATPNPKGKGLLLNFKAIETLRKGVRLKKRNGGKIQLPKKEVKK